MGFLGKVIYREDDRWSFSYACINGEEERWQEKNIQRKTRTWDCVDISEEAIEENRAYLFINKESQRVSKAALKELDAKDVLLVFPEKSKKNRTVRVLKTPKTDSSVRKVFLPKSVARMLIEWKEKQDEIKEVLGDDHSLRHSSVTYKRKW